MVTMKLCSAYKGTLCFCMISHQIWKLLTQPEKTYVYTRKSRPIKNIPPTCDALLQHTCRAAYQSMIWAHSHRAQPDIPEPTSWGWTNENGRFIPVWRTIPMTSEACLELIKCGCKTGCINLWCKCQKSELPCTLLCECGDECQH